jgi:RNA polymerase sigma factor (sigma-70 family)
MYELTAADYAKAERMARGHCRHAQSRNEVDDCIQNAYIALWRKARDYDPAVNDDFWSFAWRRVNGAITDTIRQKTKFHHTTRERVFISLDGAGANFLSPTQPPECEPALEKAVNDLIPKHREVIRRRYWNGERMHEISAAMGFHNSRASLIHNIALRKLRKQLQVEVTQ